MAKFRYEATTLNFTTGIGAPSFPVREGLSLHSYPTNKPFYTITNREHGTTLINWTSNSVQQTLRDTIEDFWNTTLSEGYNDFTVIDNRLRMLFEASWNDWLERWSKRRGGIYDIDYIIESPIPWTLPTYGIYPMSANDLVNHNLSGDDLSTTDGVLTTNATDSAVLRLNGSALKMEGDGSSSGLLGASATVDWPRGSKNNNISLFCQFMSDATLTTGNLAALEVTHSNNVFRLGIKRDNKGVMTPINSVTIGAAQQIAIDTINNLLFTITSTGLGSFSYNPLTGAISSKVDEISPAPGSHFSVGLDNTLSTPVVFVGASNGSIYSNYYNTDGTFGASINSQSGGSGTGIRRMTVDIGKRLIQCASDGSDVVSVTYNGSGTLAKQDTEDNNAGGRVVGADGTNNVAILGASDTGNNFVELTYTDAGVYTTKRQTAGGYRVNDVKIDSTDSRKIVFWTSDTVGSAGIYSGFYDLNGQITQKDFKGIGACWGVGVDTTRGVLVVNTGNAAVGIATFAYSTSDGLLTQLNNNITTTFLGDVVIDVSLGYIFSVGTNGINSFSYTQPVNQVFGKIVNNADSAEVRKGTSTYHELTNSTWYDLAFTYDAITEKSFLYFAASGTASGFTDFLDGETDITEGIGEENNQDATVQDIAWTGINLLKELTSDVVADGSNVYIQNPMVFDGRLSEHDFNTLRRLCYLWNLKTTTYPK